MRTPLATIDAEICYQISFGAYLTSNCPKDAVNRPATFGKPPLSDFKFDFKSRMLALTPI